MRSLLKCDHSLRVVVRAVCLGLVVCHPEISTMRRPREGTNSSVALQGYKLFIRNDLVVAVKTGYYLTRTRITPCHTRTQDFDGCSNATIRTGNTIQA